MTRGRDDVVALVERLSRNNFFFFRDVSLFFPPAKASTVWVRPIHIMEDNQLDLIASDLNANLI